MLHRRVVSANTLIMKLLVSCSLTSDFTCLLYCCHKTWENGAPDKNQVSDPSDMESPAIRLCCCLMELTSRLTSGGDPPAARFHFLPRGLCRASVSAAL